MQEKLQSIPSSLLSSSQVILHSVQERLSSLVSHKLSTEQAKLESIEDKLALLEPSSILKRGYAIIKQGEAIIPTKVKLKKMPQELEIIFSDGRVKVKQE